jgi:hypothetical protein
MDGLHFIPPSNRGDPWFGDGNIILLVEDDDRHVLKAFKVHRGVLARQSEVFETMFDIPQPASSSVDSVEQIDGCPVVRMYDLPNELSDLIKALYDGVWVMQSLLVCCHFPTEHIGTARFINGMQKISFS